MLSRMIHNSSDWRHRKMEMETELLNGRSDLSLEKSEHPKVSARSPKRSKKSSGRVRGKGEQQKPEPQLSEIDFLLSLWQSDCAELKQAGVEMHLSVERVQGKTAVQLILMEVGYCQQCGMFHETVNPHTCLR